MITNFTLETSLLFNRKLIFETNSSFVVTIKTVPSKIEKKNKTVIYVSPPLEKSTSFSRNQTDTSPFTRSPARISSLNIPVQTKPGQRGFSKFHLSLSRFAYFAKIARGDTILPLNNNDISRARACAHG